MKIVLYALLLAPSVLFGQVIQNESLSFEADRTSNTLVIHDARTNRTWTADLRNCLSDAVITKWATLGQTSFDAFSITDIERLDEQQLEIAVKESRSGKSHSMIVMMGKIRDGMKMGRALHVAKHRGSACDDSIVPFEISNSGLHLLS